MPGYLAVIGFILILIPCISSAILTDSYSAGESAGFMAAENQLLYSGISNPSSLISSVQDSGSEKENILSGMIKSEEYSSGNSDVIRDYVYSAVNKAGSSFDGGASDLIDVSVDIYQLPKDPVISDPSHMGREYGVLINFFTDSSPEMMSETLWWYEKDATKVIKNIFEGDEGGNIGYAAVSFYNPKGQIIASFLITAEDAGRLKDSWGGDELYIKYKDWSFVEIPSESLLVFYEDPKTGVIPFGRKDTKGSIISDDYFRDFAGSAGSEIYNGLAAIKSAEKYGEYTSIGASSSDLIKMVLVMEREAEMIPVSGNLYVNKAQLLNSLDSISKGASSFWIGAKKYDRSMISSGNEYISDGLVVFNRLMSGLDAVDLQFPEEKIINEIDKIDSLNLNTPFHYRDSSGTNDISMKIEDCHLHGSLTLKDSDSTIYPEFGKIFLSVVTDFTHMGYRGGGTDIIMTLPESAFSLTYKGKDYFGVTPSEYIKNIGTPYSETILGRKENYESVLIFEIPKGDFTPEDTYITVDFGSYGKKVWNFV